MTGWGGRRNGGKTVRKLVQVNQKQKFCEQLHAASNKIRVKAFLNYLCGILSAPHKKTVSH